MAELRQIDLICDGIGRYYKSLNKEYNSQFSLYCDDNGFDDDDIPDELSADYTECSLIDFDDDDFPFHDELQNYIMEDDKKKFILNLIRKINDNTNIQFAVEPHIFLKSYIKKSFNNIDLNDLQEIRKLYKSQCLIIYNNGLKDDNNYLYLLSLQRKSNINYIQYLIDNFHQKRIKRKDENFDEVSWSEESNFCNKYGEIEVIIPQSPNKEYIDNKEKEIKEKLNIKTLVQSGIQSFNKRCCHPITLNPRIKINDSIEVCIRYIHSISGFIGHLLEISKSEQNAICPFQMDFCIAFGPTSSQESVKKFVDDDDDDDDDKKDIDDDDDEYIDYIGNIGDKLKNNNLKYSENSLKQQIQFYYDYHSSRDFLKFFKDFKEKYGLNKNIDIYPHYKRFIILVDRRPNINTNEEKESIWIYQPPTNSIPKDFVSEWYFGASKTCLIPNINNNDSNITSSFHCNGQLLSLSFHVKEKDKIQCYLYWNGGICRFFADNIESLLPSIFNMKSMDESKKSENEIFMDNKDELKRLINDIKKVINDTYYQCFECWLG